MKRPRGAPVAVALIALPLAGCGSSPPATALRAPLRDYDEGRYALAHDEATDVMRRTEGQTHHDAAYLSGLSAYRLGKLDESELRLLTAAESPDPTTAANARATLGLVRLEQNRPAEAAALFQAAANGLTGDDHQRANEYAAAARNRAGGTSYGPVTNGTVTNRTGTNRTGTNRTGTNRPAPGPAPTAGGAAFALQVGAFKSRDRAERAASEARPVAARAGLGPARIEPRISRGEKLWVVQFGRFRSRPEAADVRSRLGQTDYIVVSAAP